MPPHPEKGIEWQVRPISHHETRSCSGDTVKVILVLSLKSQDWEAGLSPTLTFTRISMYVADGHYQRVLCCSDTSQPAQMPSANSLCYFQVDLASGSHPGFLQSEESAPVVPDELSPETWCGTNLLLCSSGKFQLKIKISFCKSELSSLLSGTSELWNTKKSICILPDIKYYYFPQIFQQNWWGFDGLIQYFNFAEHLVWSQAASWPHVNQ